MNPFALIGPLGTTELVIILIIVLIIFGPKKLPDLAEGLGKSIQKFKKAARDVQDETKTAIEDEKKKDTDLKK
jgi:sec-independent protein translocase protein TatA